MNQRTIEGRLWRERVSRNIIKRLLVAIGKQVTKGRNMQFEDLAAKVVQWAADRRIIPNSSPEAQLLKTVSELGELADATAKHDHEEVIDGIGDVLVTLVIFAELKGLSVVDCLACAYETIKDRRGTLTAEGVFVKETT
jgi:NTP pyrophosphatase (non-canonical NTP hydrolase)